MPTPSRKLKAAFLLLVWAAVGCARVYHRPPDTASLAERQAIYERQHATVRWFDGFKVQGRGVHFRYGRPYAESVAQYLDACGDTASAAMARQAKPYYFWGVAGALTCLAAGAIAQVYHGPQDDNWIIAGGALGLGLEYTLIKFGNARYVRPAAQSYNDYLRRDLRLDETTEGPAREPVAQ